MEILKEKDRVKYTDDEDEIYVITRVWNHGGNMVYYDLEAESDSLGMGFKKIQLSVHKSEIEELVDKS